MWSTVSDVFTPFNFYTLLAFILILPPLSAFLFLLLSLLTSLFSRFFFLPIFSSTLNPHNNNKKISPFPYILWVWSDYTRSFYFSWWVLRSWCSAREKHADAAAADSLFSNPRCCWCFEGLSPAKKKKLRAWRSDSVQVFALLFFFASLTAIKPSHVTPLSCVHARVESYTGKSMLKNEIKNILYSFYIPFPASTLFLTQFYAFFPPFQKDKN